MNRLGRFTGRLLLPLLLLALTGCGEPSVRPGLYGPPPTGEEGVPAAPVDYRHLEQEIPADLFTAGVSKPSTSYASADGVRDFSRDVSADYRLGPGDRFAFYVRGRQDISVATVIVSPDGQVALPRLGILTVKGLTITEATARIRTTLETFYDKPDITLVMQEYNNNKAYVLGRVAKPGAVHFHGPGTVLEALALAGGLPADTQKSFLSRCMIVRGSEMVLWLDLRDLLENGNMALNARLQNGDVVFIPQSEDSVAYVMGQVLKPGVLLLRSQMTVLDAIMHSGGITANADPSQVYLIRPGKQGGAVEEIDLMAFVRQGDQRKNYILREGDILYVNERGVSRFGYFMNQLLPTLGVIDFTLNTAERFGVMQQLRQRIWGQEGFVTPTQ